MRLVAVSPAPLKSAPIGAAADASGGAREAGLIGDNPLVEGRRSCGVLAACGEAVVVAVFAAFCLGWQPSIYVVIPTRTTPGTS